jgi:hypothetical protein
MRIFTSLVAMFVCWTTNAQIFTKIIDSPLSTTAGDSRSVNWVDVNGDRFMDCFISNGPQAGQNNALYLNDGVGYFTAVVNDPIVMDNQPSDGATFADIDNDGDLDAFVVNWYNKHNLAYINDGTGSFTKVVDGTWVQHFGFSETAAFGDYDNDGLVDLYVTNSAGSRHNFLYKNLGSTTMEPVTEGSPVTDAGSSRNVSWADIDNDGDLDLYVTNENNEANDLYRNDDGSFVKLTEPLITVDHFSTMSSSWGDIDNDRDLDLFLANDGSKNQLFRNDGNFVFTRILTTDISDQTAKSFSSAWSDIDNDGDLDLFVTNAFQNGVRLKNLLYLNDGTGHLTQVTDDVVTTDTGWSYGCAFGDYNNDGFQDLVVATTRFGGIDDPDYFYQNNGNENHWIMLSLEGTSSNKSAIGAKVFLKAVVNDTATWQMREVSAQSAYCSQNDLRVHFGIGKAVIIDSLVIEWPSGIIQYFNSVLPDQILDIREEVPNSVTDVISPFGLHVFPNPTHSIVQLEANFKQDTDKLTLEVYNDTGQIVYASSFSHIANPWHYDLDLTRLQLIPGHYIIRLSDGSAAEEKKIVLIK